MPELMATEPVATPELVLLLPGVMAEPAGAALRSPERLTAAWLSPGCAGAVSAGAVSQPIGLDASSVAMASEGLNFGMSRP